MCFMCFCCAASFLEVRDMFKSIRSDTDEMIFQLSDILRPDNVELLAVDVSANKQARVPRAPPARRQQRGRLCFSITSKLIGYF